MQEWEGRTFTVLFNSFSFVVVVVNLFLAVLCSCGCNGLSLVAGAGATLYFQCTGFLLWWLLLLPSMGSGALGLQ